MIKHTSRLLIASFVIAWSFDLLFWEKTRGISFAIFVALCLIAGFLVARWEGLQPAWKSLWLLLPIAFFAVMSFVRQEPMTSFLNHTVTLVLMAIMANTFLGGRWLSYTLSDYVAGLFSLSGSALTRQVEVLSRRERHQNESGETPANRAWQNLIPWLRGVLLAIPVLSVFAFLLAAADPIFSKNLDAFLDIFNIENLGEYIFRGFYIVVFSYLLAGIYLHILLKSKDEKLVGEQKPWLPAFLGFTEAAIILGSVVLLLASFVAIQFRYFFGGESNIAAQGFTYAEYARRGFGELVAVAFFSLLLFLGLSAITKRGAASKRRAFSGLGIALVALVGVILTSAFQRLLLYEGAYGFTQPRLYTHVFMVWLGILLVTVVILEIRRRQHAFALAILLTALGFAASLNALNVDALIAARNVERARAGQTLDIPYLATLSDDVVPTLAAMYEGEMRRSATQEGLQESIAGALACHAVLNNNYNYERLAWSSFHLARVRAQNTWGELSTSPDFEGYLAQQDEDQRWFIIVDNEVQFCTTFGQWD